MSKDGKDAKVIGYPGDRLIPVGKPGQGIDVKLPPFHPTPGKPAGSQPPAPQKQQEPK